MLSKALNRIAGFLLGGCTVLLTACYAPPSMYAPSPYEPLPDLKRSISGHVKDSSGNAIGGAAIEASHSLAGDNGATESVCRHYAVSGKEGFYYVELECMSAKDELEDDHKVTVKAVKAGFDDKVAEALFTKAGQEDHLDLDIEMSPKADSDFREADSGSD